MAYTAGIASGQTDQIFFGNLHSHTSYSDGSGKPEEAYEHARDAGLNFLAVTEHNHKSAESGAGDRQDGLLIANDHDLYNGADSDSLISAATASTVPGTFVALYGQEFSSISSGNHMNVFDVPEVIDQGEVPNGRFDRLINTWLPAHKDSTGQVAILQLNHPALHDNEDNEYGADDFASKEEWIKRLDERAELIEILNGPAMTKVDGRRPAERMEADYLTYLNLGFHVAPTADQDNHYKTWGTATDARTAIVATELSKLALLQAMRARHVYATEDKNLEMLVRINGHPAGDIVAPPGVGEELDILYWIRDRDEPAAKYQIAVFSDHPGGQEAEEVATIAAMGDSSDWQRIPGVRYSGGTQFVFVRVTQDNGTGSGDEDDIDSAWSAPVWLEVADSGDVDPVPPSVDESVASRHSNVYHVGLACKDAQRIRTENLIRGSAAKQGRTLHQGCPRQ